MTTQTPATVEMEKWLRLRLRFFTHFWLRIRFRKKNAESCRIRLRNAGCGVKRKFSPLRNFWPVIVCLLFCFSE